MKKILSVVVCSCLMLSSNVYALPQVGVSGALELFVKNGATGGDGSFETPFGSIEEARDYIRKLKKNNEYPQGGVEVNLRKGNYSIDDSIEFTAEDSGAEGAPVVYQGYGLEEVNLVGGVEIPLSDFKKVTDIDVLNRIYEKDAKDNLVYICLKDYGINEYSELQPFGWGAHQFWDSEGYEWMKQIEEYTGMKGGLDESKLYVNDEPQILARYPNGDAWTQIAEPISGGTPWAKWQYVAFYTGEYINGSTGEPLMPWEDVEGITIRVNTDLQEHMERWKTKPEDIWAYGYWQLEWADLASNLKSFNPQTGEMTLRWPNIRYSAGLAQSNGDPATGDTSDKGSAKGKNFYMYNILEELDAPGEWYLDKDNGNMYYYPKTKTGTALVTILDKPIMSLKDVSNMKIRKINFKGSRTNLLSGRNLNNIIVELCDFAFGKGGASFAGNNVKFYSCTVTQGASINTDGGDKWNLTPSGNVIENCWGKNYSDFGGSAFVIAGVGDVLRHCKMEGGNARGYVMSGCDTISEYNELTGILTELTDAGAVYLYQNQHTLGRIARHNYLHDIESTNVVEGGHAVRGYYEDDGSSGLTVHSCIFENFKGEGIWFNGGHDGQAYNNIAINSNQLGELTAFMYTYVDTTSQDTIREFYRDFVKYDVENNPAYDKYPNRRNFLNDDPSVPKYNVIKDNVIINSGDFEVNPWSSYPVSKMYEDNTILPSFKTKDPGFVDISKGNYVMREDAEVYKQFPDFEAPDFERMGLYTPRLVYRLGNKSISMLINSNIIYKGFTPKYIDEENRKIVPLLINSRTYLPIRSICENLGGTVNYDNDTKTATIVYNGKTMTINNGNGIISVDDEILSEYTAITKEGRLLVPIRALESMGEKVQWYEGGLVVVGDAQDLHDTYLNGNVNNSLIEELIRRID